ncbi:MAG: TRAP transporter small permease [bacterium]|nr:TRAP transporter small permease [bacterium]
MKIVKWLDDHLEEFFLVILLVLIAVTMLVQIFARYIFNSSLSWAEEFCRYCYIWTVFLSIGYTVKCGSMLRVGIVMDMLPLWLNKSVKIICSLVMLWLFAWFFQHSIQVVHNIRYITGEISSAMQLPMWIMYLCTTAGYGLAAIRTLQALVSAIRNFNKKEESTLEVTIRDAKAEVELLEGGKE